MDHRVIVRIRGPLVDILVSIALDVYGPYVSTTKTGQKELIVECINVVYGTMVAALYYYKKFVKSLVSKASSSTRTTGVSPTRYCQRESDHHVFSC